MLPSFAELYPPPGSPARIAVISGPRQAGKTSWCLAAVEAARRTGRPVAGLLSPGRYAAGVRTGILARCLRSGEERLMASTLKGELEGYHYGQWVFDPQTFAWGNRCLEALQGMDVLFLDELGNLEFDRGVGWTAAFPLLERGDYRLAVVVIRPECLSAFSQRGFHFALHEISSSGTE